MVIGVQSRVPIAPKSGGCAGRHNVNRNQSMYQNPFLLRENAQKSIYHG